MNPKGSPIMIGGEPGSGTTLLMAMLNAHPQIMMGPELFMAEGENLGKAVLEMIEFNRMLATKPRGIPVNDARRFIARVQRLGIDMDDLEITIERHIQHDGNTLTHFRDRCRLIEHLCTMRMAEDDKIRWGFKIMRDIQQLDKFRLIWPFAFFISLVRDGRDIWASTRHLPCCGDVQTQAASWCQSVEIPRIVADSNMVEIKYEDLLRNPDGTLMALCAHLDLEFSWETLNWRKQHQPLFENPIGHPSAKMAMKPIDLTQIGVYRGAMSEDELKAYEDVAGETLCSCGYKSTQGDLMICEE